MNPDTPSTHPPGSGKSVDHPHYPLVLKMVLWGEEKSEIYRRLQVNSVSIETADKLYAHARADRIRTLRGDSLRKLMKGGILIVSSASVFSLCWFGFGFIPTFLLYLCMAAFGVGTWISVDASAAYLMAPAKKGSVADAI